MNQPDLRAEKQRNLIQRTLVVLICIPIVVAVVWWLDSGWMTVLVAAWGIGATWEFYQILINSKGLAPLRVFGLLWVFLFIISPHASSIPIFQKMAPSSILLTSAIILPLVFLLWRKGKDNAFANWAWTLGGILYVGWLLSYFVMLRQMDNGRGWVSLALLCTFSSDIFAYLVGRFAGRHKMAPYISPNKSWEGAAAGLAGAIIVAIPVVYFFSLPLNGWQTVSLGIMISIFGQLGDLVKSLFKRNMQVKDSGNVLPGHGGFLDRMDSMAFAGVLVFYFVSLYSLGF